jgi:hypothetical protein
LYIFTETRLDTLLETISAEDKFKDNNQPIEFFGCLDQVTPIKPIIDIFGFLTGAIATRPHLVVRITPINILSSTNTCTPNLSCCCRLILLV